MASENLFQNIVILRRPGVVFFADIIKIIKNYHFFFTKKKSLKTQEKRKELEIMY